MSGKLPPKAGEATAKPYDGRKPPTRAEIAEHGIITQDLQSQGVPESIAGEMATGQQAAASFRERFGAPGEEATSFRDRYSSGGTTKDGGPTR